MQNFISPSDYAHMVAVDHGRPITTSLKVAEYFGRRHGDVLRAVQNIECSREFNERNFASVQYFDSKGEKRPMLEMTKDGFMFLVMGFTGKQAARIKEAYINAFNWMADRLRSFDSRRNEVVALYKAEQHTGSMCGRGLNRWKCVRRDLEDEMAQIAIEGQMTIPFLEDQHDDRANQAA